MDIYALVMLKPGIPGPALKPSTTDCKAMADAARRGAAPPTGPPPAAGPVPCSILGSPGMIRFGGFPLSHVASMLGGQSERMVVDRTGLTGNWEFALTRPDVRRRAARAAAARCRTACAGSGRAVAVHRDSGAARAEARVDERSCGRSRHRQCRTTDSRLTCDADRSWRGGRLVDGRANTLG
jgi:uncharacterized protein (TIGR03435 family)